MGNAAEDFAAAFLVSKGMTIIAKQFRTQIGEVDIIAKDGDEIVFVEVKARKTMEFGYPEESVTRSKLRKIAAAGETFLRANHLLDSPFRIDVVAMDLSTDPPGMHYLVGVGL